MSAINENRVQLGPFPMPMSDEHRNAVAAFKLHAWAEGWAFVQIITDADGTTPPQLTLVASAPARVGTGAK